MSAEFGSQSDSNWKEMYTSERVVVPVCFDFSRGEVMEGRMASEEITGSGWSYWTGLAPRDVRLNQIRLTLPNLLLI